MKINFTTKGYSLVEVLVAVAILMLAIVGPLTIAAKSIQSTQYARQQVTAFFLAQEGITAVRVIRNDAALAYLTPSSPTPNPWTWMGGNMTNCFDPWGCNIDFSSATPINNVVSCVSSANCLLYMNTTGARKPLYKTSASGGTASPYTRTIKLSQAGDEVSIESKVEWPSNLLGGTQSVILQSSVFNVYK